MEFLDLSTELHLRILQFCTQTDLVPLLRVNKSLQPIVEYALYSKIYKVIGIRSVSSRPLTRQMRGQQSLLTTLISDPRRASLVTRLCIPFSIGPPGYYPEDLFDSTGKEAYVARFVGVLQSVQNLTELRIMLARNDYFDERINEEIRNKSSHLRTLYCDHFLDLEGFIANQSQLQLFGIYHFETGRFVNHPLLTKIESLHGNDSHRGRTFPILFLIDYPRSGKWFWLMLFPALYPLGQISAICQRIVASVNKDPFPPYSQHVYKSGYDLYPSISVPDTSESSFELVRETIEALAYYLPHSFGLEIVVTGKILSKPWRRPELVNSLKAFKQLKMLSFRFPSLNHKDRDQAAMDLKSCLLEDWAQRIEGIILASNKFAYV
ncbi:hypothetical protein AX15_006564 [Amanita polypyramis BW_CC]|nr:hypothetical protein AX15_006564 [Amanita polypyramis BW_CC]